MAAELRNAAVEKRINGRSRVQTATKFVVDRKGNVIRRFECTEDMDDVRKFVEDTL